MSTSQQVHPRARHDYTLQFVADTPVHVGASAPDTVTDLPLATDGQGRLVIPGSSWAGVLRALARRHLRDESIVADLFGPDPNKAGPASCLFVSDTALGPDAGVESRTGVGIDRRRAAAADRMVYDRLMLAAGTPLTLRLRYEGSAPEPADRLVAAVRALGLRIGAASSRGLGRLSCTGATASRVDLTSRDALLRALTGRDQEDVAPATDIGQGVSRFELTWRTRRPVLVGSGSPGESADLVPMLMRRADGSGMVPVLPGSSVKGVLRSTVERVLRSVLPTEQPSDDFVAATAELAEWAPAFEALFGSRERAGALSVPDTGSLPDPVEAGEWRRYLSDGNLAAPWNRERTHVAIDRWSGGSADSRLFTVQETSGVAWQPLLLEIDPQRLATGHRRAAVVLLGTAVALLRDGLVGVGHGTTRGLGEIEVAGVRLVGAEELGLPTYEADTDLWTWLRTAAGNTLSELVTA